MRPVQPAQQLHPTASFVPARSRPAGIAVRAARDRIPLTPGAHLAHFLRSVKGRSHGPASRRGGRAPPRQRPNRR